MEEKKIIGRWGEEMAMQHLRKQGLEILEMNWTFLHLEIDLIAYDGTKLIIVEVKTRGTNAFGEPEIFVNKTKQKKLIRAANLYLEQRKLDCEVRFDVVGIVKENSVTTIRHIADAFSPYGG